MEIKIEKKSDIPLYMQIRDQIMELVSQEKLVPGTKLPNIAEFSRQLGVTQATINRAFEDLSRDGYIESRVGRGTFIKKPESNIPQTRNKVEEPGFSKDPQIQMATRRMRMGISKSLEALQILSQKPGLLHFTSGIPDSQTIPVDILSRLTEMTLKEGQVDYLGYGDPRGLNELKVEVVNKLGKQGIEITPENVLITSGSQQAISLMAQYALENQYQILCETPCYTGVANAFGAIGHWVESVGRENQGPDINRLHKIKSQAQHLFYLCPVLHNPTGLNLDENKMEEIKDWAIKGNHLVLADEIFIDLVFAESKNKSIYQIIGEKNCVLVGSLSKSFMCGLRIGWLITDSERIQSLNGLKKAMDIMTPPLMQGIAAQLLKSGLYEEHIVKARKHYQKRRDSALQALKTYMPEEVRWTMPQGGFNMWVELPPGYSSIKLYLLAIEKGVVIIPGPKMDIDHRYVNCFRLGYGSVKPDQINEGIELLSQAVKRLLAEPTDNLTSGGFL
ncbi:MAG: PLP-dependent aminotransferase family protein [Spirochaetes bacterium]|nr:PLP-dependent aminotransferase family protein [Spirochaetota bacterium]